MTQLIRRHPLTTFFLLAFGITWVVWVPRAAGVPLGVVGQAWTWSPAVAALLATALTGGRDAVRELGARLVRWRVGWQWYLVVILGPAAFSLAVAERKVRVRKTILMLLSMVTTLLLAGVGALVGQEYCD